MKAYKIKETINQTLKQGKLFCEVDSAVMLLATPTEPQMFYDKWSFERAKQQNLLEEVQLEQEKWVLPHLYKPIKVLLLGHP